MQKAVFRDEKREMSEKRKLLAFLCSNSTWKDGRLIPQYRQPFDLVAVTNKSYQQTKATSPEESGLCPNWLPYLEECLRVSQAIVPRLRAAVAAAPVDQSGG